MEKKSMVFIAILATLAFFGIHSNRLVAQQYATSGNNCQSGSTTVVGDQWRLKRIYGEQYLKPDTKADTNTLKARYPNYRFIKINCNKINSARSIELFYNKESETDPSALVEIDENNEEWITKFGDDNFEKGGNTSIYGKKTGLLKYEFFFPKEDLSHLLDSPAHSLEFRKLQKHTSLYNGFVWKASALRFDLIGKDSIPVKVNEKTILFPVLIIKQTLLGNGHDESFACSKKVEIDRTYWIFDCLENPFIIKSEEYQSIYCDNSSQHQLCRCPRGQTKYQINQIIEVFPK